MSPAKLLHNESICNLPTLVKKATCMLLFNFWVKLSFAENMSSSAELTVFPPASVPILWEKQSEISFSGGDTSIRRFEYSFARNYSNTDWKIDQSQTFWNLAKIFQNKYLIFWKIVKIPYLKKLWSVCVILWAYFSLKFPPNSRNIRIKSLCLFLLYCCEQRRIYEKKIQKMLMKIFSTIIVASGTESSSIHKNDAMIQFSGKNRLLQIWRT